MRAVPTIQTMTQSMKSSLRKERAEPPGGRAIVARFEIGYRRFLDADGTLVEPLPEFARAPQALVSLYRGMVLARAFDEKAIALQRTGRLGTYASCLGQEAVGVGVASAMRAEDVLLPSFREQAAQFWRGVSLVEHLLYWAGDERGSAFKAQPADFPICVPVGTHFTHAAGVALAMQRRKTGGVAVAIGGDGSTSKGDFYEAINMAGVWRLPAVFVINNNEWAISVPRRAQSAAETLAQKAIAAGIPGEQVDGNDVIAVRDAAERAMARARSGAGASLIEALSYRLGDHTTADDARRYRDDAEVSARWKAEPIGRLRRYLAERGGWTKEDEERLHGECRAAVEAAVGEYLALPHEPPEAMFDHLFARLPPALEAQRQAVQQQGRSDA
jgi:2-oxoisovalerate dehydrogenase E1 component alpha subunit